jgi:hypothetical protein
MTVMTTPLSARGLPSLKARAAATSSWRKRLLAIVLAALMLAGVAGGIAYAADENDDDMSLYAVGSSITAYFSSAIAPGAKDGDYPISDDWQSIMNNPATGGDVVGYADKDYNPITWVIAQLSSSAQSVQYDTLGEMGPGVIEYAQFGATLNSLGLDTSATGLGSNLIAMIGGFMIFFALICSQAVNVFFTAVLTLLGWFNPFKLLFSGVNAISPTLAQGMIGGSTADLGPLKGLSEYIGGIYSWAVNLSMYVMIPMFIVITGLFLVLGKRGSGMVRKLIVRVLFIVIGIPLLGSMYTNSIDTLQKATAGADTGAIQVVSSTFVDFEGWANQTRLAVPDGATIEWDTESNQPSAESAINVQDSARAINGLVHPSLAGAPPMFGTGSNVEWNGANTPPASSDKVGAWGQVQSMLFRYMGGVSIPSSTFASDVQGVLSADGVSEDATSWFSDLRTDKMPDNVASNPVINVQGSSGLKASHSGTTTTFTTDNARPSAQCGANVTRGTAPMNCNMSVMAMYNYLNTSFGDTAATIYSPNKVSSGAVQEVHKSVSMVGTGMSSFIYWFNAMVLLTSFVVVGFGYAVSMMVGNVSKGLKVITSTPFAVLGAIPAITKVIVYVVVMVLELFVTIFLFKMFQELLMAMPKIFTYVMGPVLDKAVYIPSFATAMALLIPLLGSILVIAITIMALRLRKSVVKALSEASTKLVEALTGGQPGGAPSAGGPGALKSAGSGVAAGAGMVMAGKAMGGGSSSKPSAASAGVGPDSASASGTADTSTFGGPSGEGESGADGGGSPTAPAIGGGRAVLPAGTGQGGTSDGGEDGDDRESAVADTELGSQVASKGLTATPSGDGSGKAMVAQGIAAGAAGAGGGSGASGGSGADGADAQAPVAGDSDFMDSAYSAGQADNSARKEIAKEKRGAATEGAVAAGTAVKAGARAYAGDAQGATQDGLKAAQKAQGATQRVQGAKASERRLDNGPSPATTGQSAQGRAVGSSQSSQGATTGRSPAGATPGRQLQGNRPQPPAPRAGAPRVGKAPAARPGSVSTPGAPPSKPKPAPKPTPKRTLPAVSEDE